MTNYRKNGPVNIPTESEEDDVFEIDGDAVAFEGDITVLDAEIVFVEPVAEIALVTAESEADEVAESGIEGAAEVAPTVEEAPLAAEPEPVAPEPIEEAPEAAAAVEPPVETAQPVDAEPDVAAAAEEAPAVDPTPSKSSPLELIEDLDDETAEVLAGYLEDDSGFDDFLPPIPPPRGYTAPSTAEPFEVLGEPVEDTTPSKEAELAREVIAELKQEVRLKSEMLARMTDEKSEMMDRILRKQAEFENFRKRGEREMQEAYTRARADVIGDLLSVLDNLDLAIKHADGASAEVLLEGIQLIYKQMLDSLGRIGLEPIEADGQVFNPELHEAVATETNEEVPDHTVVGVLQRGFKLGDRLLRPARVKVAVQP